MSKSIVLATNNNDKVKEIRAILADVPVELLPLSGFENVPEMIEDGETLNENALIKARIIFHHFKMPVLADDTGLEVFSLGGQPGVYSARYAGEHATYADNRHKLLHELNGKTEREAQFRCTAAFIDANNEKTFEGICPGRIIETERGNEGFGYDPIFIPDGFDKTFGELPHDVKNRISHRAKAFVEVKKFLIDYLK